MEREEGEGASETISNVVFTKYLGVAAERAQMVALTNILMKYCLHPRTTWKLDSSM